MLFDLLGQGIEGIRLLIILIPVVLFSISLHEVAHGWLAYKMGDPTAKYSGRLTLNPIKHFNPIGFIMMLILGFGWATPVPVNPNNFKNPKKGMLITALAGPASNMLVAIVTSLIYVIVWQWISIINISGEFAIELLNNIFILLSYMMLMNVGLAIFNLIPIYPLDGSRVLDFFMPQKYHVFMMKYGQYIQIGFLLIVLCTDIVGNFVSAIQGSVVNALLSFWNMILQPIFGLL